MQVRFEKPKEYIVGTKRVTGQPEKDGAKGQDPIGLPGT